MLMLQQVTEDVSEEPISTTRIHRLFRSPARLVCANLCVRDLCVNFFFFFQGRVFFFQSTYEEIPLRVSYAHQVYALHQRVEFFPFHCRRRRHRLDRHERIKTLDPRLCCVHAL
jgi:hypothetical protein